MRITCTYSDDRDYNLFHRSVWDSLQICHIKFGITSKPDDKITSTISVRAHHKEVYAKRAGMLTAMLILTVFFPLVPWAWHAFASLAQDMLCKWNKPLLPGLHPHSPQTYLPRAWDFPQPS